MTAQNAQTLAANDAILVGQTRNNTVTTGTTTLSDISSYISDSIDIPNGTDGTDGKGLSGVIDAALEYDVQAFPSFSGAANGATQRAKIQAALDAAGAQTTLNNTFSTVSLPAGWIKFSGLRIPYGVTLAGAGVKTTYVLPDDYDFAANPLQGNDATPYFISGNNTVLDGSGVRDIHFHGSNTNPSEAASATIPGFVALYLRALWDDLDNAGSTGGWHRCRFENIRFSSCNISVWSRGGYSSSIPNLTNQYLTFIKCEGTNPSNQFDGWRFTGDHAQISLYDCDLSCKQGNYANTATANSLLVGHDPAPIKCHNVINETALSANKGCGEINLFTCTLQSQHTALKIESSNANLYGCHVESTRNGVNAIVNSNVTLNGVTMSNAANDGNSNGVLLKTGVNCIIDGTYIPSGTTNIFSNRVNTNSSQVYARAIGTQAPAAEALDATDTMHITQRRNGVATTSAITLEQLMTFLSPQQILTLYDGAAGAYSLRKLINDYSGSAIRVRRSNDDVEIDIGFNGDNDLDVTALTAFVGANDGHVTTIYDQSGNERHFTQDIITAQPRIVIAGTVVLNGDNKNAIDFDGSNDNLNRPLASYVNATNVPDASGGVVNEGFTCTGLTHDATDDTFWFGNDGRGEEGDNTFEPSIVQTNKAGDTKISEILINPLDATIQSIQGVTIDTTDVAQPLFAAAPIQNKILKVSKAGALLDTFNIPSFNVNGLAYDGNRDSLWACAASTNVYELDKTTGAILNTYAVTTAHNLDQLYYDSDTAYLWATSGANSSDGTVVIFDTANNLAVVDSFILENTKAIEGIHVEDGNIYIANDAYFHQSTQVKNQLLKFKLSGFGFAKTLSAFTVTENRNTNNSSVAHWTIGGPLGAAGMAQYIDANEDDAVRYIINTADGTTERSIVDNLTTGSLLTPRAYAVVLDTEAKTLVNKQDGVVAQNASVTELSGVIDNVTAILGSGGTTRECRMYWSELVIFRSDKTADLEAIQSNQIEFWGL